jgi:hypothetical protein
MAGPPEVSQVPLCPIFDIKFLKRFFWNFSRNFIFEDFSEKDKRIKLGKTTMARLQANQNQVCNSS